MAATITYLGTMLNGADSSTGWVGGSLETTTQIHGTGCIGLKQATGSSNYMLYNYSSGVNFTTGDNHVYIWGLAASAAKLNAKSAGGISIRLGTATNQYFDWYMDGNDTYTGGWKKFVLNPLSDPDGSLSPPADLSAITYIGLNFVVTSQFSGSNLTLFTDAIHIGTGLQITGTSTTDTGFEDIWTDETGSTKRYGIINKIGGVYFAKGELVFGDTASATNPNFSDSGSTVVFEDQRTSNTLYKIKLVGNSSDSTNSFRLGTAIGSDTSTIGSKGVTIAAAGSATSNATAPVPFSFVSGASATITRGSGSFKTDGLKGGMFLQITGTSSNNKNVMCVKVAALTITLATGETLTTENNVTTASIAGTRRVDFTITDTNVKTVKLYGSTIKQAGIISLGSTSTAISPTIEIVDTTFSNTRQVVKNVTTSSPLFLRSNVNFNTNLTASMNLYDAKNIASTEWNILQGTGFQSTLSGTQTLNLTNYNFNNATTPYITLETNETWNAINPNWTITNQTQLNFGGGTLSGAFVNEKYSLSITVQTSSGTAIQNARTYIYEGQTNQILPADNKQTTNSSGAASSNILKNTYVGAASALLTTTAYGQFAQRVYFYTYSPFVSSFAVTAAVTQTITLVSDSAVTQSDAATAVTTGVGTVVTQTTGKRLLLYSYKDTGTNVVFTTGQTITGATSGHTGTVAEVSGTATSGKIIIRPTTQADTFNESETINGSGGTPGKAAIDKATTNDSFTWEVACASITVQNVYNYLAAHMAGRRNPIAYQYDASPTGFLDYTTEAKNLTTDDTLLMPTTPASGDIFYFGDSTTRFEKITINISTVAITSTIVWEYWNGSGWTDLASYGLSDGTNSFKNSGTNNVTFTPQTNWAAYAVNSTTAYWVRARQSAGSPATQPKATIVQLDPIYESVHTWGTSSQGQLLYSGTTGFYTNNAQITKLSVDDADATTGWTPGTASAVALDTTRFKQGTGAVDLTKNTTTGNTASASKTTTSRSFASAFFGVWVRITSGLLALLDSSTAVTVRFGSDSDNYYVKSFGTSVLAAGWNYLTFNKYNATSTTGTPVDATCVYTYVSFTKTDTAVTAVGDFVFDDIATFTGNSQGVYLSTRGAGTIDHFTADFGATFAPPTSVTVKITGVNEGARCYVVTSGGTEIINAAADSSGEASASYTYTGTPVNITAKARNIGYLPFETTGTISGSDLTITAVWQVDPNTLIQLTGVNIQFTNPATITRASGDFGLDGWDAPGYVTVTGSTSNNGKYQLSTVGTTTLTITGATLTNEGPVAGVTLTWSRT